MPVYLLQTDAPYVVQEDSSPELESLFLSSMFNKSSPKPNSYFRSDEYLAKSAEAKQADLWEAIMADTTPGKFPSAASLAGIFAESMDPTFTGKGDAMPAGMVWGQRTKYIHSVGAVGKVKFLPEPGNKYSGIFKGANYGLVRFSSAAAPSKSQPLAPGLGLKFLRDGTDSANLVSMWGVEG